MSQVKVKNLEAAIRLKNISEVRKVIHDLRSNLSVVGLQPKLESHLKLIQANADAEMNIAINSFEILSQTCDHAMEQVKSFVA